MRLHLPALFHKQKIMVYALVGPSGTGKSFRSKLVAQSHNIDLIIDDGLLIKGKQILAGTSAKRADSYLGAIRIAIFENETHRAEVRKEIQQQNAKSILILGTSDKMINRICERLDLPAPFMTINISDVATKDEIQTAIDARKSGKHVIPVPIIELEKRDPFPVFGSLLLSLPRNIFSRKKKYFEKTIVQPDYESPAGTITISRAALTQMLIHCAEEFDREIKIKKLYIRENGNTYILKLGLEVPLHSSLPFRLSELRDFIIKNIEKYTGILLEKVDINIVSMSQ